MQRKLDCRNWRLVLTGHSLGAGAAALIALHLRGRFASERLSLQFTVPSCVTFSLSASKLPGCLCNTHCSSTSVLLQSVVPGWRAGIGEDPL